MARPTFSGGRFDASRILPLFSEMTEIYLSDDRPWIIGYSGGKDSTVVVQLALQMLKKLPSARRNKTIHIISSDTLVESPIIEERLTKIHKEMVKVVEKAKLPVEVKLLRPDLNDSFWVNLIGRGYPSPNRWFRWCTDRLKIKPATKYIKEQVKENGEVVILLGARKNESASRAQTMGQYSIENSKLKSHNQITGAFVYTPIEDWGVADVWSYLLKNKAPWGSNKELKELYNKGDHECGLQLDIKAPSCGATRFGCWVCTVVEKDRSLEGLIKEGEDWMKPLLEFRNYIKKIRNDPEKRSKTRKQDVRKRVLTEKGGKEFSFPEHRGHTTLGPFTFKTRHDLLLRLMKLQNDPGICEHGLTLISSEELKAIETMWIYEGDNISSLDDVLQGLEDQQESVIEKNRIFEQIVQEVCSNQGISRELLEKLVLIEKDLSMLSNRVGIYNRLEAAIDEHLNQEFLRRSDSK